MTSKNVNHDRHSYFNTDSDGLSEPSVKKRMDSFALPHRTRLREGGGQRFRVAG